MCVLRLPSRFLFSHACMATCPSSKAVPIDFHFIVETVGSTSTARLSTESVRVVNANHCFFDQVHLPADRLIAAPDCGMKYLPRHIAFAKLQALAAGASQVRDEMA